MSDVSFNSNENDSELVSRPNNPNDEQTTSPEGFEIISDKPSMESIVQYVIYGSLFIFNILMTAPRLVIALAGIIHSYYFNGTQSENQTVTPQAIVVEIEKQASLRQQQMYAAELENFEMIERIEEEEHRERMEREREERKRKRRIAIEEMDEENQQQKIRKETERNESNLKLERMKTDQQTSKMMKDQMAQIENELLKIKHQAEQEELEKLRLEEQQRNQEKIDNLHKNISSDNAEFQTQQSRRKVEIEAEEQRNQKKMGEIQERLAYEIKAARQRAYQRRMTMENLTRDIYRMLRNSVWNEMIENNWTHRLNTLRSVNQDVVSAWRDAKMHCTGVLSDEVKSHLIEIISVEKSLMEDESDEMKRMYSATGKQFLLEIQKAVYNVKLECVKFATQIQNDLSISDLEKHHSDLFQASNRIPTLAELKRQYSETMH